MDETGPTSDCGEISMLHTNKSNHNRSILVVIPALNEAEKIIHVVSSVPKVIQNYSLRTLVVDDGSTDATVDLAKSVGAKVISHGENLGLGAAFHTGLQYALGSSVDIMVSIDADGQFDPKDIALIVGPCIDGSADFVAADRFHQNTIRPANMSSTKYWGNRAMTALVSRIVGRQFADVSSGFRAYSRDAMLWLNLHGKFTYTQESFLDLANKGLRIKQVPVKVIYFPERRSRIANSIARYATRTAKIIFQTARDHKPLRVFGSLGNVFLLSAFLMGLFVLIHYFKVGSFSPYIFVAFASAFTSSLGIIFWGLGILADMLVSIRRNQERLLFLSKKNHFYIDQGLPTEEK